MVGSNSGSASVPIYTGGNKSSSGLIVRFSPGQGWSIRSEDMEDSVSSMNRQLTNLISLACQTAGRNLSKSEWEYYFPGEPYRQICPDFPTH